MDIFVTRHGLRTAEQTLPCALGRGGIRRHKREGDGATPTGTFPLREVLYRPDRLRAPITRLPVRPIRLRDGWCDAPDHPSYNRPVRFPFNASAERLWRADPLYDLIVVLGYNDDPVVPGEGSAIFLHIARPNFGPTEGCVALRRGELLRLLIGCDQSSRIIVR